MGDSMKYGAVLTSLFLLHSTGTAAPPGFVPLWNGRDLAGWHYVDTFDPRQLAGMSEGERSQRLAKWGKESEGHWRVEGNEIVNDGKGAYLTTDNNYGDIELMLEFKMAARADSGVYLRGCPQVQIWDPTDPGNIKNGSDKGSGGLWNNSAGAPGKDPLVRADKPIGEWNKLRVVQVGERVSVWLNEQLVVGHARKAGVRDEAPGRAAFRCLSTLFHLVAAAAGRYDARHAPARAPAHDDRSVVPRRHRPRADACR